jgi:hypothetical protein
MPPSWVQIPQLLISFPQASPPHPISCCCRRFESDAKHLNALPYSNIAYGSPIYPMTKAVIGQKKSMTVNYRVAKTSVGLCPSFLFFLRFLPLIVRKMSPLLSADVVWTSACIIVQWFWGFLGGRQFNKRIPFGRSSNFPLTNNMNTQIKTNCQNVRRSWCHVK